MLGAKTASQAQVGQGDVAEGGASQSSPNVASSAQQQQQQGGGAANNEQVRVYIARYDYNPYDGPNPCPEVELYLQAGNYFAASAVSSSSIEIESLSVLSNLLKTVNFITMTVGSAKKGSNKTK